ncbi:AraC family transcriptional regulator [Paenibacillus sp. Soil787]|uniref:AraC family transcriptional regulator n=1 Tax=Paenibacillus sp. Soil787 TaxID=1736411 RepID=UPI0006FB7593|nr:AraC family transcriptional regulator [Paenibacillus sp. Soil787]KRF44166.1 hypothetical protein ASG93_04465 [Paenibacillus sp. Soil787]
MFRKLIFKNPYQLFLTILLPFLLSTVLLLFAQSSLLSRYFENYALQLVYNQQKTDLQNTSRNVSVMAQTAKSLAVTAFFDSTIKNMLFSDIDPQYYIMSEDKLRSYKVIYPFLQSMYIYNGRHMYVSPSEDFVYDRSSFADKGVFSILDNTQHNRSNSIVLRSIPNVLADIDTNVNKFINVYSFLFYESPVKSGKVSEGIILNLSEESIKQSISSSDPNNRNRIFIVDHDGKLMSDDTIHPLRSDLSGSNYLQTINSNSAVSGNLRMNIDGVDSFITYASTEAFDWKLISITPYNEIVKDIERLKAKTYLFVFGFIIGSVLLSLYFSRRLYTPIKAVIQNYNMLENEKKNDFYYKKQDFLRKMLHTDDLILTESMHKQFDKYKIKLEPREPILLILIKLDNFMDFNAKYNLADRNLLKFGIVNIVSELYANMYPFECIETEEDQILIVMNGSSLELPSKNERLVALVKEIQHNTEKYLNISTSFTFSEPFESLTSLNFQYLKTLDLSYYRLILGHKSLIFYDHLPIKAEDFKYPQDQDKALMEALIQGQAEDAKKIVFDIIRNASQYSYTVLNSVLIQLLISIRYAIEIVEANHSMKVNFNFNMYFIKLQKIETLKQIESDFNELFEDISMALEAKKDNKYVQLIEDVNQIIHKEFSNPALSLDMIAEQVNLNPEYLRKLLKKHQLISVNDLINQVRLKYASELITSTEDSINAIMEKSGFLSRSHFFTLFKKAYGITPNQFRSNAKSNK